MILLVSEIEAVDKLVFQMNVVYFNEMVVDKTVVFIGIFSTETVLDHVNSTDMDNDGEKSFIEGIVIFNFKKIY